MDADPKALPDDVDALKAALIAALARAHEVEANLAVANAMASEDKALIAHQRLRIAKLERQVCASASKWDPTFSGIKFLNSIVNFGN